MSARLLPFLPGLVHPWWMRWLLAWLLCVSYLLPPTAQGQAKAFRFEKSSAHKGRVPFSMQRNLMVVQANLNGHGPYNFLLDTGVGMSLITDPALRDSLHLRLGKRVWVSGAGGEAPLEAFQIDSVHVKMKGIVAPRLPFIILSADVLNLSGYVGMKVHGILGFDVFNSFVVQVQPGKSQLLFHQPATFVRPRGKRWASLPLDVEAGKAYLHTSVTVQDSVSLPIKLILDTGAGHALSLETTSDPRLQVPNKRLRAQLGRGLNGLINGYLGRVTALQLGRYHLNALLTSFPDPDEISTRVGTPRNGNIGFEILKRFEIIIDYTHTSLMLRPNSLFKDPFEHDMCGFDLLATGPRFRNYLVISVEVGSPADSAGLQPNDEILSVNFVPCQHMTLTQMSRLFHSADGRPLLLVVRRPNGELFTTVVQLKRQI